MTAISNRIQRLKAILVLKKTIWILVDTCQLADHTSDSPATNIVVCLAPPGEYVRLNDFCGMEQSLYLYIITTKHNIIRINGNLLVSVCQT